MGQPAGNRCCSQPSTLATPPPEREPQVLLSSQGEDTSPPLSGGMLEDGLSELEMSSTPRMTPRYGEPCKPCCLSHACAATHPSATAAAVAVPQPCGTGTCAPCGCAGMLACQHSAAAVCGCVALAPHLVGSPLDPHGHHGVAMSASIAVNHSCEDRVAMLRASQQLSESRSSLGPLCGSQGERRSSTSSSVKSAEARALLGSGEARAPSRAVSKPWPKSVLAVQASTEAAGTGMAVEGLHHLASGCAPHLCMV
jgi:hypothetical protein